MSLEQEKGKTN